MTIVDNRKKKSTVCFSKLKVGDTFQKLDSNEVYMKTENLYEITYEYDDFYGYGSKDKRIVANAICLDNGKQQWFGDAVAFIPVKCECVIKE